MPRDVWHVIVPRISNTVVIRNDLHSVSPRLVTYMHDTVDFPASLRWAQ